MKQWPIYQCWVQCFGLVIHQLGWVDKLRYTKEGIFANTCLPVSKQKWSATKWWMCNNLYTQKVSRCSFDWHLVSWPWTSHCRQLIPDTSTWIYKPDPYIDHSRCSKPAMPPCRQSRKLGLSSQMTRLICAGTTHARVGTDEVIFAISQPFTASDRRCM